MSKNGWVDKYGKEHASGGKPSDEEAIEQSKSFSEYRREGLSDYGEILRAQLLTTQKNGNLSHKEAAYYARELKRANVSADDLKYSSKVNELQTRIAKQYRSSGLPESSANQMAKRMTEAAKAQYGIQNTFSEEFNKIPRRGRKPKGTNNP